MEFRPFASESGREMWIVEAYSDLWKPWAISILIEDHHSTLQGSKSKPIFWHVNGKRILAMNSAKSPMEAQTSSPAIIGENASLLSYYFGRWSISFEPRPETKEQASPHQSPSRNPPYNLLLSTPRLLDLLRLDLPKVLHYPSKAPWYGAYKRPLVLCKSWTSAPIRDLDGSEMDVELAAKEIY
jgi:hypothetical protein